MKNIATKPPMPANTKEKIWLRVKKDSGVFRLVNGELSECWIWLGHLDKWGYGWVSFAAKMRRTYQLMATAYLPSTRKRLSALTAIRTTERMPVADIVVFASWPTTRQCAVAKQGEFMPWTPRQQEIFAQLPAASKLLNQHCEAASRRMILDAWREVADMAAEFASEQQINKGKPGTEIFEEPVNQ